MSASRDQLEYCARLFQVADADPVRQPYRPDDPKHAKLIRQKIDQSAKRSGLLAPSRVSPFAGARISARIREVPLDE